MATEPHESDLKDRPGARASDIPALTGLRFIAALSVVVAHCFGGIMKYQPPDAVQGWVVRLGPFGMTLFFVLSGFVIHYNYRYLATTRGWRGFGAFLWARFARLYPLFLLMLGFGILFDRPLFDFAAGNAASFPSVLRALPYYLLFMQSWFYVLIDGHALPSAVGGNVNLAWSISTEWFFYFAYPLIAWLVLRLRRPVVILAVMVAWSLLWGGLAATLSGREAEIDAWAVARYGAGAGMGVGYTDSFIRWLRYVSPYLRIGEFILGCLTAQLYLQQRDRPFTDRRRVLGMLLLGVGVVSVPLIVFLSLSGEYRVPLLAQLRENYGLAPSVALIMFSVARYDNPISRLLGGRTLGALGEASYSIYLTHAMIFFFVSGYVTQALPATAPAILFLVLRLVFAISLTCLISLGLHAVVEVPARRWLRGLWRPGSPGRRRLAIALGSAPAVTALSCLVLVTHFFHDKNDVAAGIRIISATYGASCGVERGNVTPQLVDACNGQEQCGYIVDVVKLGDPAGGCAKDFRVEYACMPDGRLEAASLPGEAGMGSRLSFRCDDAAGIVEPARDR